ncbi:hypothetical protein LPTSP4_36200 [Leptospira ryugenii]|uniref:Uncharacterized protein n=1 Tax=Leptospira ryugenii TaxID=1917863 RepID=A0A2P2E5E7_9LEPT|nr:SDR family oxidoreductase [Leptospira ryugenii]GBF52082.1 hypothetical protein LPTSP4_36200 [Leptospira ryugenii]
MEGKTFLIFGISKGLGKEITDEIPGPKDVVFGVSRSNPLINESRENITWIKADLSMPVKAIDDIKKVIGDSKIDCLIYNVGIWESTAFSEEYNFQENTSREISSIVQTNITSCILSIQAFIENMKKSTNAKIILIGSTWGLDNHNGREVSFSASKFAIRGIAHAIRENLRESKIGVTVLNLGYLATEYQGEKDIDFIAEKTGGSLIPLQDVIAAIKFVLATTPYSCVKEITMPAMADKNV